MVNFKKLKYRVLNHAKTLHENGAIESAVFIPLVGQRWDRCKSNA